MIRRTSAFLAAPAKFNAATGNRQPFPGNLIPQQRINPVAQQLLGYYGGGIAETASETPRCPVLLHFGETDQGIPPEHWARIRAAHPEVPIHTYPAGHWFSCDERGSYHEASARLAREHTLGFFTALL